MMKQLHSEEKSDTNHLAWIAIKILNLLRKFTQTNVRDASLREREKKKILVWINNNNNLI